MYRYFLFLLVLLLPALARPEAQDLAKPWVMVNTTQQTLSVIRDDKLIKFIPRIAIGRNGYGTERVSGDGKTPLGIFHVAWINPNSQFRLFFGLNYPTGAQVESAFRQKIIDFDTYFLIRKALFRGKLPPQNTVLGGNIGIHGLGSGNRWIHETSNWTEGCVAVNNQEIDELAQLISLGTEVIISDDELPDELINDNFTEEVPANKPKTRNVPTATTEAVLGTEAVPASSREAIAITDTAVSTQAHPDTAAEPKTGAE